MEAKYLALIVILIVWVVLLLVLGFLSWIYQVKHREVIAKRKQYFADYKTLQQKQLTLTPLNLDLKLSVGEEVYAYEEQVQVYSHSLTKTKKVSRLYRKYQTKTPDGADWETSAEQTRTGLLRWTYSLKQTIRHNKDVRLVGTMLVTNHRVVFFNPQTKISLSYDEISEIAPIMVLVEKDFLPGLVLTSKQGVFEVVNHNLKTIIILQSLKKLQKG